MTKESDASVETADLDLGVESVTLSVESSPKGAIVAINGERRGRTPLAVELTAGEAAKVRFSLQGYRTELRQVVAGEDETLRVRLRKKSRPAPPPIKTDF